LIEGYLSKVSLRVSAMDVAAAAAAAAVLLNPNYFLGNSLHFRGPPFPKHFRRLIEIEN